jgi:hypothetical protein
MCFVPIGHAQVLGKVVDGCLDGMACGIVVDMALQQLHVDCIRRVIVLLRSFLQRKLIHLNGVDFHRDNVSVETTGHALGYCRLPAAGRTTESNDEDSFVYRRSNHDALVLCLTFRKELDWPW